MMSKFSGADHFEFEVKLLFFFTLSILPSHHNTTHISLRPYRIDVLISSVTFHSPSRLYGATVSASTTYEVEFE